MAVFPLIMMDNSEGFCHWLLPQWADLPVTISSLHTRPDLSP